MASSRPTTADRFVPYWNTYASEQEAAAPKASWSQESVKRGILAAAVQGITALLGGAGSQQVSIERLGTDDLEVYATSTHIVHEKLRVSVVGIGLLADEFPNWLPQEIERRARESVCLCVFSASDEWVQQYFHSRRGSELSTIVPVYPNDLDALARHDWDLEQMVDYKLHRRFGLDKPELETQYDKRLVGGFLTERNRRRSSNPEFKDIEDVKSALLDGLRTSVDHPLVDRVCDLLQKGRNCLLRGASSSGKSVLALQAGDRLRMKGLGVQYLNLRATTTLSASVSKELLRRRGSSSPDVLIIDDLQSSPSSARHLLAIANISRRAMSGDPPVLLAVAWPDFAPTAATWLDDCALELVRPEQLQQRLVQRYGPELKQEDVDQLLASCGGDLLLLKASLETAKDGRLPSRQNVAEALWKARIQESMADAEPARSAALVAGSLGRYDIAAPGTFIQAQSRIRKTDLRELEKAGLLRRNGNFLTLGHRSLCGLLVDWLAGQGAWQLLGAKSGPTSTLDVVLDYLRFLGSTLAVDTLRSLQAQAGGFKEAPHLSGSAAALVEIWKSFNTVVERVEHQQSIDPQWGSTPSSAMFAVQALAKIGKGAAAQPSIDFLRRHWSVEQAGLQINLASLATNTDFTQIGAEMAEEDALVHNSGLPGLVEAASSVDVSLMHKSWLSGVFLCAEAALDADSSHSKTLAEAIERAQLNSGAFYPERVPWVTARIVLGLTACGKTKDSSKSVLHAVDWLLKARRDGGACTDGVWKSGTGTWNSTHETTAMVLLALISAGVEASDPRLSTAQRYLLSERAQWTAPGKALDGATCLQAFLDTGGRWRDVAPEAQYLSQWAQGEALWQGATLSAEVSLKQSCSVAQVASHLVSIGWTAVRADLPVFLDALSTLGTNHLGVAVEEGQPLPPSQNVVPAAAASTADPQTPVVDAPQDRAFKSLRTLSHISLSRVTVVGNYRRYDERERNKLRDWAERINSALEAPSTQRENFLSGLHQEVGSLSWCKRSLAQMQTAPATMS
jgi:hypothetical protein